MHDTYLLNGGPSNFQCNPKGLGWELYQKMKLGKEKIGQACCNSGLQETYGEMLKRAIRVAINLRKYNLTSEDVIVLNSYSQFNDSIAWIASLFVGCKVATIDPQFSLMDLNIFFNILKPKVLFVEPEIADTMAKALKVNNCKTNIVVFGHTEKHIPFSSFLCESPEEETFVPVECKNVRDTAIIVFSSGSSGLPKGVCLSHYAIMSQIVTDAMSYMRCLTFTSLYWISSVIFMVSCISANATRFLGGKYSQNSFWHIIKMQKINAVFLPPHLLLDLIDSGLHKDIINTTTLKFILLGGAPITAAQVKNVNKALPNMIIAQTYGLTEACGSVTLHSMKTPRDLLSLMSKPGSAGILRTGFQAKIVNPDTEALLGPNQVGEMRLKSESLFSGYYNADSSDAFDEDGWFKTGDLMYYDDDQHFYHVDRQKEIFKYRQIHIQPVLLESILSHHEAVLAAIVIGKPDPRDGHQPMALVQLKRNYEHVSADEIKNFFDSQVDDFKKLRGGLKIVDNFPLTVTGKISRKHLKHLIVDN